MSMDEILQLQDAVADIRNELEFVWDAHKATLARQRDFVEILEAMETQISDLRQAVELQNKVEQ